MKEKQVTPYKKRRVLLDKKASMIVCIITMVLAVAARTAQLQSNMNFSTGKYIDDSIMKNYPLLVIVLGFAALMFVMIAGESRDKAIKSCILLNPMRLKADRLNKKLSPAAAVGMLIMAVLTAFDLATPLVQVGSANMAISTEDNPVFVFAGIPVLDWFMYALMLILVITFAVAGANILKGEGLSPINCFFFSAFPVLKLLHIFDLITTYQIVGPYSERVYIMLADMLSAIFFLHVVRFFMGFEKKHTRFWLIISGYMAAIFAAVSTLPRYIMFFSLDYKTREGMMNPETIEIGVIFVALAVVSVFWSTYVYRVMPKLSITGMRRWKGVQLDSNVKSVMKSIDED